MQCFQRGMAVENGTLYSEAFKVTLAFTSLQVTQNDECVI